MNASPINSEGSIGQSYTFGVAFVNRQNTNHDSRMNERETRHGVQLGQWVRARRTALGMTQEQVWDRMGAPGGDMNWITHLEGGRRKSLPDTDYLVALSEALRTTMTDVLRGAGVLPIDVEETSEHAPGSQTMHALVDMIDWTMSPDNRQNVEDLLRVILNRQRASSDSAGAPVLDRA